MRSKATDTAVTPQARRALEPAPAYRGGPPMWAPDIGCPVCDADLILAGDEKPGDLVHCTFCGVPFVLHKRPKDDEENCWEIEDDF
jgi:hypothetical protein